MAIQPYARGRGALPAEYERQRVVSRRMADLRVVERGEAEQIAALQVVELNVELAAGDELAAHDRRVHPVAPTVVDTNVGTVALEREDQIRRNFVARLEAAVVERHLVARLDVVGAAGVGRPAVVIHELRLAVLEREAAVFRTARI